MEISLTVIVCHYEQHKDLRRCIESILSQSDTPEYILIIDDASKVTPRLTDLPSLQGVDIRIIAQDDNAGTPALPRNVGVSQCTTSHLAFLDADDQWLPHTVLSMKRVWEKWPDAIAHGDIVAWMEDGSGVYLQEGLKNEEEGKTPESTFERLFRDGNKIFLSTTGGPTWLFQQNPSDVDQVWEDYDLWLRLASLRNHFVHTGSIHTLYQVKRSSRSRSRRYRHSGCKGIKRKHFKNLPAWQWPLWYWKQRWL